MIEKGRPLSVELGQPEPTNNYSRVRRSERLDISDRLRRNGSSGSSSDAAVAFRIRSATVFPTQDRVHDPYES